MIKEYIEEHLSQSDKDFMDIESDVAQRMLSTLDRNLVDGTNSLGLPYWAKQSPQLVRRFTYVMLTNKMGTTKVKRKWSEFIFDMSLLNQEDILAYRTLRKLSKYTSRLDTKEYPNDLVKSNGTIKKTGLRRLGFAIAAKRRYKFDTAYITKYRELIKSNLIKSITKGIESGKIKDKFLEDKANYSEVTDYVIDYYLLDNEREYNNEYNISDSRGRAILQSAKRLGNIISSKDFRAIMRVNEPILVNRDNKEQMNDIYYFIAELCGSKAKSEITKIAVGKRFYKARKLPTLCADELHEHIWLERIYAKLDRLYEGNLKFVQWDIPLEIDASMSIAQIAGALVNDQRLLERTNALGSEITDPWYIDGVRRLSGKFIGTPTFYGSSQSATSLLRKRNFTYVQILEKHCLDNGTKPTKAQLDEAGRKDQAELVEIRKEFNEGGLSVLKQLKNALINGYSNHKPSINVKIWNDSFNVEANKWKRSGTKIVVTEVYTTKGFKKSFTHEPKLIPDYAHMKLYWATCLIHGIDSQIMNNIIYKMIDEWIISIHDAALALPGIAGRIRKSYAIELKQVNIERKSILNNYRVSIGATALKDNVAFMKLDKAVQQAPDEAYNACAMK